MKICVILWFAKQILDEYGQARVNIAIIGRKISGVTKFGEEVKKARITLTESTDALMGTQMFSYLEIDFEGNKVRIK